MLPVRPKVVLLRGYNVNPWDLRVWELLADRFEIVCLLPGANEFDVSGLRVRIERVGALRDRLPAGRFGRALAYAAGDRYDRLEATLRGADIVHAAELDTWFSAQAARLRGRLGFRLALTAWETIPALDAYRWPRARRYRKAVLGAADLLLPASERARRALLLEGADPARTQVCYPGIDTTRFGATAPTATRSEHLILSPGRLVWEKGHQDVMRAVAVLRRGLAGEAPAARLMIVGSGPEEKRLRRHARELGIADVAEFRPTIPYDEMPTLYSKASVMALASLPRRGWEEQFGMVLAEALASRTPIVAARSGAIPEVVGDDATLFDPGDWFGLARALLEGPLSRPAGERADHDPERIRLFSVEAAAERMARAYDSLLAGR
jgi:glycosyltransferase involved in cell wall biosynthesis